MRRAPVHRSNEQGGFTLVELLVVISILGIISFGLTEAVILGFKTTDGITTDVTRIAGLQAFRSYVTDDIAGADKVNVPDPVDPCMSAEVFLHLTEGGERKAYSLEAASPPVEGERQLFRSVCSASGVTDKRMLGLLEFTPPGPPILALCEYPDNPPLSPPTSPPPSQRACTPPAAPTDRQAGTVTLRIRTNRPSQPLKQVDLTVRRGTT